MKKEKNGVFVPQDSLPVFPASNKILARKEDDNHFRSLSLGLQAE
jgi:hypothetical protein